MENPIALKSSADVARTASAEELRTQRLDRQKSRFRDRGGIFVPSTRNTLIDILLGRSKAAKSPTKRNASASPTRGNRKQDSGKTASERFQEEGAPKALTKASTKVASRKRSKSPQKRSQKEGNSQGEILPVEDRHGDTSGGTDSAKNQTKPAKKKTNAKSSSATASSDKAPNRRGRPRRASSSATAKNTKAVGSVKTSARTRSQPKKAMMAGNVDDCAASGFSGAESSDIDRNTYVRPRSAAKRGPKVTKTKISQNKEPTRLSVIWSDDGEVVEEPRNEKTSSKQPSKSNTNKRQRSSDEEPEEQPVEKVMKSRKCAWPDYYLFDDDPCSDGDGERAQVKSRSTKATLNRPPAKPQTTADSPAEVDGSADRKSLPGKRARTEDDEQKPDVVKRRRAKSQRVDEEVEEEEVARVRKRVKVDNAGEEERQPSVKRTSKKGPKPDGGGGEEAHAKNQKVGNDNSLVAAKRSNLKHRPADDDDDHQTKPAAKRPRPKAQKANKDEDCRVSVKRSRAKTETADEDDDKPVIKQPRANLQKADPAPLKAVPLKLKSSGDKQIACKGSTVDSEPSRVASHSKRSKENLVLVQSPQNGPPKRKSLKSKVIAQARKGPRKSVLQRVRDMPLPAADSEPDPIDFLS